MYLAECELLFQSVLPKRDFTNSCILGFFKYITLPRNFSFVFSPICSLMPGLHVHKGHTAGSAGGGGKGKTSPSTRPVVPSEV